KILTQSRSLKRSAKSGNRHRDDWPPNSSGRLPCGTRAAHRGTGRRVIATVSSRGRAAVQDDDTIGSMAALEFARTTVFDDIDRIYEAQQRRREAVGATDAPQRIAKLRRLHDALLARRDEIRQALWDDYRKPAAEVDLSEIYPAVGEARHAMRHLRRWMRPRRVATPIALIGSRSRIYYEPKGV